MLEMHRRTLQAGNSRRVDRISNRVTKIVAQIRALDQPEKSAEIGH